MSAIPNAPDIIKDGIIFALIGMAVKKVVDVVEDISEEMEDVE